MQQKLAMMQYAIHNYHLAKTDFESTQNMTIPALYGMGKTKILFYVESAIVFARNSLDVSACIYSDILLNRREDPEKIIRININVAIFLMQNPPF